MKLNILNTFNFYIKKEYFVILLIIFIVIFIISIISMFKIFKKDNIKPWFSFIPILNVYYLFKICKIPFWTMFIPIVNIIVLFLYPYRLSKQYRLNDFISIMSVLFPYIIIPYIAFSKLENKDKLFNPNFLKTIEDVNKLETSLVNDTDMIIDDKMLNTKEKRKISNLSSFVEDIESTIINDEIIYDEPTQIEEVESDEIIPDLIDLNGDSQIKLEDVEVLESDLNTNVNQQKTVVENITDFDTNNYTNESIAFGGKDIHDFTNDAKEDELKCKKCGSSLVGAQGFCPGCGTELKKVV